MEKIQKTEICLKAATEKHIQQQNHERCLEDFAS